MVVAVVHFLELKDNAVCRKLTDQISYKRGLLQVSTKTIGKFLKCMQFIKPKYLGDTSLYDPISLYEAAKTDPLL